MINKELLDGFKIKDMNSWENVNAELIITDPPFGIKFSGKNGNYHRNVENVYFTTSQNAFFQIYETVM
ncbi:hypothetical protein MSIBF_A2560003 [groundwater metagenome]|uniref:DNA methylase N-4/N-6 domain-containing protein n=1 Tax=groundwater metagenome TaxID=717931 RepID=A0A098E9E6_9ZZZZ